MEEQFSFTRDEIVLHSRQIVSVARQLAWESAVWKYTYS